MWYIVSNGVIGGNINERFELYKRCETEGVGISVMKAFSGGQLLDDKRSPFGKKLTKIQCIQYDLDKPGVLTVLPGIRIKEDLEEILKYENSTEEEKDYSIISDLSISGDTLAKEHYRNLEKMLKIVLVVVIVIVDVHLKLTK